MQRNKKLEHVSQMINIKNYISLNYRHGRNFKEENTYRCIKGKQIYLIFFTTTNNMGFQFKTPSSANFTDNSNITTIDPYIK